MTFSLKIDSVPFFYHQSSNTVRHSNTVSNSRSLHFKKTIISDLPNKGSLSADRIYRRKVNGILLCFEEISKSDLFKTRCFFHKTTGWQLSNSISKISILDFLNLPFVNSILFHFHII